MRIMGNLTSCRAWTSSSRHGELITLLGRNGAGRTTTLKAILGMVGRRSGSIVVKGNETIAMPTYRIARLGIGYCPEERGIFASLSATENLLLPPSVGPGGMSLDEIYQMFPNLAERTTGSGTRLSGGEQQMLALARILRTGADILLLDEITEGLAPVIVNALEDAIRTLKQQGLHDCSRRAEFLVHPRHRGPTLRHRERARVLHTVVHADLKSETPRLQRLLGLVRLAWSAVQPIDSRPDQRLLLRALEPRPGCHLRNAQHREFRARRVVHDGRIPCLDRADPARALDGIRQLPCQLLVGLAAGAAHRRCARRHHRATMLRHLYRLDPLYGMLLTFALAWILEGMFRYWYGATGRPYEIPDELYGVVDLGFLLLPLYRVWVVVAAVIVCLGTWLLIERTKLGSYLRAATENPKLVEAFGINVPALVTLDLWLRRRACGICRCSRCADHAGQPEDGRRPDHRRFRRGRRWRHGIDLGFDRDRPSSSA